jgi:DnaJ-class molecular chaperone
MSRYYGPGRCPECDGRKWRPTYCVDGDLSIDENCCECDGTGMSVDTRILWQDLAKAAEKWVWK